MNDVKPGSEEVYPNAIIETGLNAVREQAPWPKDEAKMVTDQGEKPSAETVRFQGLRVAYFALDRELAKEGRLVLNRIVSLKEDAGKGA